MSNHNKLLISIRDYLTRFQLQVKIATTNSEYDINHHAENIIIPIFDIVFNTNFRNANDDKRNFESLDLIDDNKKHIGIQVTSTNSLEKIKSTLTKFIKYGHQKKIDEVYVYILTEKQRSYSQDSIDEVITGKIKFNSRHQIIDATDLYRLIKRLNDVQKFNRINEILEYQFSDIKIHENFNYSDFASFKQSYKEKCLNNFSRLNFFGLSVSKRPREVELYELFVPPMLKNKGAFPSWKHFENSIYKTYNFSKIYDSSLSKIYDSSLLTADAIKKILDYDVTRKFEPIKSINDIYSGDFSDEPFSNIFNFSHRLVLLGNPGAGKSSIIKYSICKILENDESVFADSDIYRYLPFRIELHKYNQAKVANNVSFAEFLVLTLAGEYQTNITLERVIKILNFFPCIIFFDGIDEIFDIQERINVRNDIENFALTYPDAKILVSSRYESYEEVSFEKFYTLEVRNFNQDQLENYVRKWYKQEESDTTRRSTEIEGCLAQLVHVDKELKYNPLLLSLILILYRNELDLPTNKLSIYEGCTNTIVEHRDEKEKKIKFNLPINNKASVFSAIAFWQFDNSNKKINNAIVKQHVKQYLIKNGEIEDEREAEKASTDFLEFAKVRSIYFENKFTHKTFLEYFTAYYIFSKYYIGNNQRRFNDILDKNIGLSSWAVVLELLICKIDSILIEPKLIGKIIESQLEKNRNDALLFFLQILKYLTNINEKIIINLFSLGIRSCFTDDFFLKESKIEHKKALFEHLVNNFNVQRFKAPFLKAFERLITEAKLAPEQLISFAYELSNPTKSDLLIKALEENGIAVVETAELYLIRNFDSIDSEDEYLNLLKDFVDRFGKDGLPVIYKSTFEQNIFLGLPVFNWVVSFIFSVSPSECHAQYQKLKDIGLSQHTIRRAINHKMLTRNMVEPYFSLLHGLPQSGFRDFLQVLIKPMRNKTKDEPVKFYDAYYKKKK